MNIGAFTTCEGVLNVSNQVIETHVEEIEPGFWQAELIVDGFPMAGAAGFQTRDSAREWLIDMMEDTCPAMAERVK